MERRYTTCVIRHALKGTPAETKKTKLATDWESGIFTAIKYWPGDRQGLLGATVFDVQSWLARRGLSAHEWILRKLLEDAAHSILKNGPPQSRRHQQFLDKETGFDKEC